MFLLNLCAIINIIAVASIRANSNFPSALCRTYKLGAEITPTPAERLLKLVDSILTGDMLLPP